MAVTTLATNVVPLTISSDGGSTYKTIVCRKSVGADLDSAVSEEVTDCGVLVSLAPVKWGFDVEGVVNTTPSGSTEVSAEDLVALVAAQTAIKAKFQYPTSTSAGTDLYIQGDGYLTNIKITGTSGSLLSFSSRFTGTGTVDVTP